MAIEGDLLDPATDAFKFAIDMRIRNHVVRSRRKALGFTQRELGKRVGVGPGMITHIECLRSRPSNETRAKLAEILGCQPSDVWPDWLDVMEQTSVTIEAELNEIQLSQLRHSGKTLCAPPPEESIEPLRSVLSSAISKLSYREREILKLRFGLSGQDSFSYTYEEIAHIFKVTRERVRQIEAKAIRKLQEGDLKDQLAEALA